VRIRRLPGPCSAKRSLERDEETDWSQISRSEQRSHIKSENLRGKNQNEIHNALHEVFGDSVVDRSTVSQWASRFREGWVSIQYDPRSGRQVVQRTTHLWLSSAPCWKKIDANHVKKLRMKQTCQPLLFSES